MEPYIVRGGDHFERIAFERGFDAATVWDDPQNAQLKAQRCDAGVLCAGDVLMIPSPESGAAEIMLGGENSYVTVVPSVRVALRMRRRDEPCRTTRWEARGGGFTARGTTTAEGDLAFDAPTTLREVVLALPELGVEWVVQVGGLDPLGETSGLRARLENLGFLARGEANDADLAAALRTFQRARGLDESGAADEATVAALREAHGR